MSLSGFSVLLVDDHLDSLEIAELSLLRAGAIVRAAPNGHTALRFLDTQSFDVIVSDLAMPGIDGYELARRVRARHDAKRSIPLLAISGNACREAVRRALEAGFDAHTAKPVEAHALVAYVEQLVTKRVRRAPRAEHVAFV